MCTNSPAWGYRIALAIFCGSVFLSGCEPATPAAPMVKLSGGTMGTFYEVTINGLAAGPVAESLQQKVDELLEQINLEMSTYIPESEISRFNASSSEEWFAISPGFAAVVQESLKLAAETGGAFDPTVGPLVNLWHFGPEIGEQGLPTAAEIAEVKAVVGYEHLEVREEPPAIRKKVAGLKLDLSAIAKGYGVDRVSQLVADEGYANHLINIGGEIVARGTRANGERWRLAIEKPVEEGREIQEVLRLSDQAMATSGDYRNFYEHAGRRYSHTIDPQTGQPVEHELHSVSVLAESCMRADGLATALMVMGPEKGWKFAEAAGLDVYLTYGASGKLVTQQSADFPLQKTGDE